MDMGYIEALVKKHPINPPIEFPPVNTPVCLDFPSETISAWFSCLKHIYHTHKYHEATQNLIKDAIVNGRSFRENVGKNRFFNEIQNAVRMFRLNLQVRDVESGISLCCPLKTFHSGYTNKPVNVEITLPDNYVLKTIDFYGHVLHVCPCKSVLDIYEREFLRECYVLYKEKRYKKPDNLYMSTKMNAIYDKIINVSPLRIKGGLRIGKIKGAFYKLMLIYESALRIRWLFDNVKKKNEAKCIVNKLRMEPDNLFDPEFSTMRKKMMNIDDSLFK